MFSIAQSGALLAKKKIKYQPMCTEALADEALAEIRNPSSPEDPKLVAGVFVQLMPSFSTCCVAERALFDVLTKTLRAPGAVGCSMGYFRYDTYRKLHADLSPDITQCLGHVLRSLGGFSNRIL